MGCQAKVSAGSKSLQAEAPADEPPAKRYKGDGKGHKGGKKGDKGGKKGNKGGNLHKADNGGYQCLHKRVIFIKNNRYNAWGHRSNSLSSRSFNAASFSS